MLTVVFHSDHQSSSQSFTARGWPGCISETFTQLRNCWTSALILNYMFLWEYEWKGICYLNDIFIEWNFVCMIKCLLWTLSFCEFYIIEFFYKSVWISKLKMGMVYIFLRKIEWISMKIYEIVSYCINFLRTVFLHTISALYVLIKTYLFNLFIKRIVIKSVWSYWIVKTFYTTRNHPCIIHPYLFINDTYWNKIQKTRFNSWYLFFSYTIFDVSRKYEMKGVT